MALATSLQTQPLQYNGINNRFLFKSQKQGIYCEVWNKNTGALLARIDTVANAVQKVTLPQEIAKQPLEKTLSWMIDQGYYVRWSSKGELSFHLGLLGGEDYQCVQTLKGHSDIIYTLNKLSNGCLVSGSKDTTIKLWNPKNSYQCVQTLQGHEGSIHNVIELSNELLASGSGDKTIKLWKKNSEGVYHCI